MEEAVAFAEWVAQNHFRLANIKDNVCFWVFEDAEHTFYSTTEELYEAYRRYVNV